MDIAQYISDILKKHQEVSLPDIGTFSKRNQSAYLKDGIFFPPSQQVTFSQESGSSALLVQHIVSEKNISESSALYFIERFCENLQNNLRSGSKVEVSPLGFLSKGDTGYIFEASKNWQHVTSFGLSPVEEIEIISRSSKKQPINVHSAESAEAVENESTEPANRSRGLWISIFALLILVAIAGVVYVQYPQYFQKAGNLIKKKPAPKALPVAKPDTIKEAESFADSILQELELQGMQGTEVVKTPDSVTVTATKKVSLEDTLKVQSPPAKVYEIIVASFGLQAEAENAIKTYRKRNLDAKLVIDTKKPKFKVGIGTFNTSDAAHKENKRVQKEITKDAWVLTINNKEN